MDRDQNLCHRCKFQHLADFPHGSLKPISRVPNHSTIYWCNTCRSYWNCSVEHGWELMLESDKKTA